MQLKVILTVLANDLKTRQKFYCLSASYKGACKIKVSNVWVE